MILTQQSVVLGCTSSQRMHLTGKLADAWRLYIYISIATHLNASSDRYALAGLCCTVRNTVIQASYSQCWCASCLLLYVHVHYVLQVDMHQANWQQRASTYFAENVDMQLWNDVMCSNSIIDVSLHACRNMIANLGQKACNFSVSEDSASFAMLVDAMYAPELEVPLTVDCIDELSGKNDAHK